MRAVNLLPGDESAGGRKAPPVPVLVGCIGAVLVAALLAVLYLSASSSVANQRRALEQVQSEYAAIPAPPAPSAVDSQLPKEQATRVSSLATALGQRVAWDRILREVSQVVPSDVFLTALNAQSPTIAPPIVETSTGLSALPLGFVVSGCTYSQDAVARFLARLDVIPDLTGITLGKSDSGSDGASTSGGGGTCPKGLLTFSLQGNVRPSGATS
jgi:Tfp pilus assembly protein PilN